MSGADRRCFQEELDDLPTLHLFSRLADQTFCMVASGAAPARASNSPKNHNEETVMQLEAEMAQANSRPDNSPGSMIQRILIWTSGGLW